MKFINETAGDKMTSFCVKLAEIVIEIHALYPTTRKFFKDYLTDGNHYFRCMYRGKILIMNRSSQIC